MDSLSQEQPASGSQASCGGVASSSRRGVQSSRRRPFSATVSEEGSQENLARHTQQGTLPGVVASTAWQKQRQRAAEIEIERTHIECNISFNVLRLGQWKSTVKAIANVGPCDD